MSDKITVKAPDGYQPTYRADALTVELGPTEDVSWSWKFEKEKWFVEGFSIVPRKVDAERKCGVCMDTGSREINHPVYGVVDRVFCEYCEAKLPKGVGFVKPTK